MTIIETSREFTPAELFNYTRGNSEKLRDLAGQAVQIDDYVIFEKDGKEVFVVSVNGTHYGSISPTFIASFKDLRDLMASYGQDVRKFAVRVDVSKAGREFLSCEAVD